MFFVARGHRLSSTEWRYQGDAVQLNDANGVNARLQQLGLTWVAGLESSGHLNAGDVIHGCVKRAKGFYDAPAYIECTLRLRRNKRAPKTIAFGNCLARICSQHGLVGFASIVTKELSWKGQCSFNPHRTCLSGNSANTEFSWLLHPGRTLRERATGRVSVRQASGSVELDLKFPSKWEEDNGGIVKVAVEREGLLLGHVMRSFNPAFARGYRVALWIRDEIPVFEAAVPIEPASGVWDALLLAIFGTWFCYAPVKGERSSG